MTGIISIILLAKLPPDRISIGPNEKNPFLEAPPRKTHLGETIFTSEKVHISKDSGKPGNIPDTCKKPPQTYGPHDPILRRRTSSPGGVRRLMSRTFWYFFTQGFREASHCVPFGRFRHKTGFKKDQIGGYSFGRSQEKRAGGSGKGKKRGFFRRGLRRRGGLKRDVAGSTGLFQLRNFFRKIFLKRFPEFFFETFSGIFFVARKNLKK